MKLAILIVCIFALMALVATALNDAPISRKAAMIMTGGHKSTLTYFYEGRMP